MDRLRWFLLATPAMVPLAASADLKAGLDAYKRGDYATALREFRPLAEQGDARTQHNLGQMYMDGEGVPRTAAWP